MNFMRSVASQSGGVWVYPSRAASEEALTTATTPTVIVYSLTTCGWCAKAKAYFRERGISPFIVEFDMAGPDLQARISAEMTEHGATGFPFVKIGAHVVPGYSPQDYERLLKAA
jgi:glutaredoxin